MNKAKVNEPPLSVDNASWMEDPLWYKDAVIYELHIKAFFDSDNNGMGDFAGLIQKLDYIQDLGVNTLWLLPFYPSPMRDDGYDISDYRNIHPMYGTMANFRQFVKEAHRRSLKVITELVINHTSDQHPWFQVARRAPAGSSKRDFYVWSDTDQKFPETRIIFSDTEKSNWAWDDEAQAYYWHRFFHHQPDLNFNNPLVVKEVIKLMRFWLDLGVDGLRLDAIPYLCVQEGTQNENLPGTHAVIKQMREVLDAHYTNRVFLAEVNQWPEDVRDYFSDGDECHMAYHFPLMPRMYIAIAQEDRHPIVDIIRQSPNIPETCQWTIFLRNHDELTLEMVTDNERDYMYQMYIDDSHARLNIGIRCRLAPLMGNETDKIKLMNNLLLSMPGSPCIYYGDEIGMGDNFFLGDRNGLRTPMQWNPDRNAGFSRADPQRLYLPPIMDLEYGYGAVNVEAQLRERGSLLNWMRRVLALRKNHQAFGRGALVFLHPLNRKILAYLRSYENDIILCVSNLSRNAQAVELDLSSYKGYTPVELMGRAVFPLIGQLPYLLTLPGYNYYWFLLTRDEGDSVEHAEYFPPDELPTLVLFKGLQSFFRERVEPGHAAMAETVRVQLEEDVLPRFVAEQRWYGAKDEGVRRVGIDDYAQWEYAEYPWLIALFRIEGAEEEPQFYFIPLSLAWENGDGGRLNAMTLATVAKVRHQAKVGILGDAFADPAFCRSLVRAMGAQQTLACEHGRISFSTTKAFAAFAGEVSEDLSVRQPSTQGSNTVVVLGEKFFLKGYRHLQIGTQPEFEIGRFLTDVANFPNTIPVLGIIEYQVSNGNNRTLALLQRYIENQGDCWSYTLDYLNRSLEDARTVVGSAETTTQASHGAYLILMDTLGRRTGELHNALGKVTGNLSFDPEPITETDLGDWVLQLQAEAVTTLDQLELHVENLSETAQEAARTLLTRRKELADRIQACVFEPIKAVKTRYHGDLHLGQVLLTQNDFMFIDFEGEPARPLAERLHKHSPLRDVAGMLRSFDYVAHTALVNVQADRPEDLAMFEALLNDWEAETGRVFLAAYDEAAQDSSLFSEQASTHGLLDLFLLEKVLYEVRYELDNRPDWVIIPLLGILALVQVDVPQ
ncbi:maltose alpha-D-glucosyltransferase [Ferrovum sp.]|uniref:maltose alpha-D-glucosyltransferase n=1 Tax=Ferrovum sp. TaxID=2609467 RepID=UPI002619C5B9|nr:maltose alpha-D-glucosyltransferase [Ferrovum sp.]